MRKFKDIVFYVYAESDGLPVLIANSPKEVASFIGCHLATVYRLLENENLSHYGYKVLRLELDDDDD